MRTAKFRCANFSAHLFGQHEPNLEYGKLSLPKVGECDYTADNGQTYREFRLTKEQTINGNAVETVSARELHEFLESKQDFSTWIKNRIEKYEFVENQDFVTFSENSEKGRPRLEYALTLDMAKELSMVERNEQIGLRTVSPSTILL